MKQESQQAATQPSKWIALFTAVRFLTVIPVPWQAERDGELFQESIYYFTLVGLLIGGGGFLVATLLSSLLPAGPAAFFCIVYLAAISGFLHLDGLADSGDGLLSARASDVSLAIMKDSRTGAMGAIVLVLLLLGKYSALSSLSPAMLSAAVFCMPLAGRCAILLTMAVNAYARPEGGLGGLFYSSRARKAAALGFFLLLICCSLVVGWLTALFVILAMVIVVTGFSFFCRKRIGGVTGDTLGAMCELTELAVAMAFASLILS